MSKTTLRGTCILSSLPQSLVHVYVHSTGIFNSISTVFFMERNQQGQWGKRGEGREPSGVGRRKATSWRSAVLRSLRA